MHFTGSMYLILLLNMRIQNSHMIMPRIHLNLIDSYCVKIIISSHHARLPVHRLPICMETLSSYTSCLGPALHGFMSLFPWIARNINLYTHENNLVKTQLHKSNTFPSRSYFAPTSTPITSRSRFLIRCRLDLAPSCRSILLKCNHVNISPLLAREMCFLLLLCSAEFETSS